MYKHAFPGTNRFLSLIGHGQLTGVFCCSSRRSILRDNFEITAYVSTISHIPDCIHSRNIRDTDGFLFVLRKKVLKLSRSPGRGGPYGCETSRLPHFLNNRLNDGGEVVSLKRRPPFTPRKIPSTHFC
jgi:hypothetical protein